MLPYRVPPAALSDPQPAFPVLLPALLPGWLPHPEQGLRKRQESLLRGLSPPDLPVPAVVSLPAPASLLTQPHLNPPALHLLLPLPVLHGRLPSMPYTYQS